jgi:hypothetical protein
MPEGLEAVRATRVAHQLHARRALGGGARECLVTVGTRAQLASQVERNSSTALRVAQHGAEEPLPLRLLLPLTNLRRFEPTLNCRGEGRVVLGGGSGPKGGAACSTDGAGCTSGGGGVGVVVGSRYVRRGSRGIVVKEPLRAQHFEDHGAGRFGTLNLATLDHAAAAAAVHAQFRQSAQVSTQVSSSFVALAELSPLHRLGGLLQGEHHIPHLMKEAIMGHQ